jgi:anthranilate synthase component 2
MVVLIDNYDSFSYNLYQLIGSVEPDIKVLRNDEMTPAQVEVLHPDHLILSPGPGRPEDAGICQEAVLYFQGKVPILGVCLGHQAICQSYGATVSYAKELMHGKQSVASFQKNTGCRYPGLFENLGAEGIVGRYHSLAAVKETLPDVLLVTSSTKDGEVMSVQHKEYPTYGLQFHPESILTPDGRQILKNFLKIRISG